MNDNEVLELNELCSGLVDGTLTEAQHARLAEMLRGSAEARRFYVRVMGLSASLHTYAAEMLSEAAEPANIVRPDWRRRAAGWLAAAAAVMLGLWAGSAFFREADDADPEAVETVARLTGSKDCEWRGLALAAGDEVAAGQRLDLMRGFAELTFDCGAQVVIEGPAVLDVRSAWETGLASGTLKASVPQEAIGFRVTHPAVEVVDLGTEFSMTAHNGAAEVFVLAGAVEVHPKDADGNRKPKSVLREKQARRFAGADTHEVADRDAKFQKLARKAPVEPVRRALAFAHWSFDEGAGRFASAAGTEQGVKPIAFDKPPEWTDGPFGSAVRLDGATVARAELAGALKRGARTVAFWARVPETAALPEAGAFVSLPMHKSWAGPLTLAWNRAPGEGVLGALRMQAAPGGATGSTRLHDGKWHHIAAVFPAGIKAGARPRMKLYVDGRLENLSLHRGTARPADKASAQEGALTLGAMPGSGDRFAGEMDELVLADQQLSPQQIRHLIRSNLLLSYEVLAQN